MIGQGKTIGLILMLVAAVLTLAIGLYLFSGVLEGRLTTSGLMLGLVLVLVLAAPLFAGGIYLRAQGRNETLQYNQAAQQKKLLNIVKTHGKVEIPELALELNFTRDQVKEAIYDLVGKGLFTGYINWDDGILYAREASVMQTTKCPNCGGIREVVGKGVVKCPFCGSELFL